MSDREKTAWILFICTFIGLVSAVLDPRIVEKPVRYDVEKRIEVPVIKEVEKPLSKEQQDKIAFYELCASRFRSAAGKMRTTEDALKGHWKCRVLVSLGSESSARANVFDSYFNGTTETLIIDGRTIVAPYKIVESDNEKNEMTMEASVGGKSFTTWVFMADLRDTLVEFSVWKDGDSKWHAGATRIYNFIDDTTEPGTATSTGTGTSTVK